MTDANHAYQCGWAECTRPARYFGLAGSALMVCHYHFVTHLEQLQRDLSEVSGKISVALREAKDAAIRAASKDIEV